MVFSPNHRLAFVANLNSGLISVLDLVIGAEIKPIRIVRLAQSARAPTNRLLLAQTKGGVPFVGTDSVPIIF
jgi:hypothetical protein